MIKLATAPDAWGVWHADGPNQIGWERYPDAVRDAGFTSTETGPWGYLPTDPAGLSAERDGRGLSICGLALVHGMTKPDAMASLVPRLEQTCALLRVLGVEWVVLMDDSALHAGSGVETEDEIERLLAETPANLAGPRFDFGHHAYAGADAVAFMRRYENRIPYDHFKNVDPVLRKTMQQNNIDFVGGFGSGMIYELDRGVVDFARVKEFLDGRGFDGYAVYEQDMYPCPPEKPFPIARHNRAVLRALGI